MRTILETTDTCGMLSMRNAHASAVCISGFLMDDAGSGGWEDICVLFTDASLHFCGRFAKLEEKTAYDSTRGAFYGMSFGANAVAALAGCRRGARTMDMHGARRLLRGPRADPWNLSG